MNIPKRSERGFTVVELLIVITIVAILAALAIPNLLASRKSGNEVVAISALRSICNAEQVYRNRFGTYGTLAALLSLGYIDDTFATPTRRGYVYTDAPPSQFIWSLNADPDSPGQSGDRYFFIDESGVIRFSSSGTAGNSDQPVGE